MSVECAYALSVAGVVEPCGVKAIGRCKRCGAGFCQSHKGIYRRSDSWYYNDVCRTCSDADEAVIREAEDRWRMDEARIPQIVQELRRAGVKAELRSYERQEKRMLIWRKVTVPLEPAWPVGQLPYFSGGFYAETSMADAGITPSSKVVLMRGQTGGRELDEGGSGYFEPLRERWTGVASALERLIAGESSQT